MPSENCPANQERLLKDRAKKNISGWKNILSTVHGNRFEEEKKDCKDLMEKQGNPALVRLNRRLSRFAKISIFDSGAVQPSWPFKRRPTDFG